MRKRTIIVAASVAMLIIVAVGLLRVGGVAMWTGDADLTVVASLRDQTNTAVQGAQVVIFLREGGTETNICSGTTDTHGIATLTHTLAASGEAPSSGSGWTVIDTHNHYIRVNAAGAKPSEVSLSCFMRRFRDSESPFIIGVALRLGENDQP